MFHGISCPFSHLILGTFSVFRDSSGSRLCCRSSASTAGNLEPCSPPLSPLSAPDLGTYHTGAPKPDTSLQWKLPFCSLPFNCTATPRGRGANWKRPSIFLPPRPGVLHCSAFKPPPDIAFAASPIFFFFFPNPHRSSQSKISSTETNPSHRPWPPTYPIPQPRCSK